MRKNKFSDGFQKEFVQADYQIEYPVLCYTGAKPDIEELNIVNLADTNAPITTLELENLQLHSFVEYADCYDVVKICFLAFDRSTCKKSDKSDVEVVLC